MSTKEERITEILAEHAGREGPLLPILHDVQHEFGCVDAESEKLIAQGLNVSRAATTCNRLIEMMRSRRSRWMPGVA